MKKQNFVTFEPVLQEIPSSSSTYKGGINISDVRLSGSNTIGDIAGAIGGGIGDAAGDILSGILSIFTHPAYIGLMDSITDTMQEVSNNLEPLPDSLPNYLMSNNAVYYDNTPRTTYTIPKTQTVQYKNVGYSQPISSQNRIDYINKPNTTGYVKFNNLPRSNQEITMEVKKKPLRQEIDYKAREEKLNPYANEQSQIRNRAKKYPLLDNTIRQQNVNYNYQEPRTPLMGDSDYVPVRLYENNKDKALVNVIKGIQNVQNANYEKLHITEIPISKIIETLKDLDYNKLPIQTIKDIIKSKWIEATKETVFYDRFGVEATEDLIMSKKDNYLNTEYAKQFYVYENYKELPIELRDLVKKKILSFTPPDKLETIKGIYIDPYSDSAKRLAENKDLARFIKDNEKKLKNGLVVNGNMKFITGNFALAIGKTDICEMKINQLGEVELLVIDTYDFNANDPRKIVIAGRELQDEGFLIPYFIIYYVKIPKNMVKKIFK